ncbi:MAG: zinc-binding dehydrogenase [Acidimicrobiales bacterium]
MGPEPTCRAVVFNGDGTYDRRTFAMPRPQPGGAVLKVEAVGLCASDVAQLHGHKHVPGETSPVVPGHEIVGRVHELGPDADLGVEVGQRVGVDLVHFGGRDGSGLDVYGYTIEPTYEHGLWGGYAEYMGVLPGTHLVPLTDDVPAAELSLFEPLASIVNWSDTLGLHARDRLVIQGPGHMGLIACAFAASQIGVRQIIVTGTSQDTERLAAARAVGAHESIVVDDESDLPARIRELTRGGATAVMELTAMATQPVSDAIEMCNYGGRVLLGGLKNEQPVEIISDHIVLKALQILAGAGSTPASMDRAGEVLNSGTFPAAALLGETYDLDQLDEALQMLERRIEGRDAVRVSLVHRA